MNYFVHSRAEIISSSFEVTKLPSVMRNLQNNMFAGRKKSYFQYNIPLAQAGDDVPVNVDST